MADTIFPGRLNNLDFLSLFCFYDLGRVDTWFSGWPLVDVKRITESIDVSVNSVESTSRPLHNRARTFISFQAGPDDHRMDNPIS